MLHRPQQFSILRPPPADSSRQFFGFLGFFHSLPGTSPRAMRRPTLHARGVSYAAQNYPIKAFLGCPMWIQFSRITKNSSVFHAAPKGVGVIWVRLNQAEFSLSS